MTRTVKIARNSAAPKNVNKAELNFFFEEKRFHLSLPRPQVVLLQLLHPQLGSPSVPGLLAIMPARRKRKKEPDKPEIQSNLLSEEEWIEKGKNSDFEEFFGLGNLFPHASHLYGRTFLCFWL